MHAVQNECGLPQQFNNTTLQKKVGREVGVLHLVNLATLRDVNRVTGLEISVERFRANLLIDGVPAWSEYNWVAPKGCDPGANCRHMLRIGSCLLEIMSRTIRCPATQVNPNSAERDLQLPRLLEKHFPQSGPYFGIYVRVVCGGTIKPGDPVCVLKPVHY